MTDIIEKMSLESELAPRPIATHGTDLDSHVVALLRLPEMTLKSEMQGRVVIWHEVVYATPGRVRQNLRTRRD